jgi:hypothetical protein
MKQKSYLDGKMALISMHYYFQNYNNIPSIVTIMILVIVRSSGKPLLYCKKVCKKIEVSCKRMHYKGLQTHPFIL